MHRTPESGGRTETSCADHSPRSSSRRGRWSVSNRRIGYQESGAASFSSRRTVSFVAGANTLDLRLPRGWRKTRPEPLIDHTCGHDKLVHLSPIEDTPWSYAGSLAGLRRCSRPPRRTPSEADVVAHPAGRGRREGHRAVRGGPHLATVRRRKQTQRHAGRPSTMLQPMWRRRRRTPTGDERSAATTSTSCRLLAPSFKRCVHSETTRTVVTWRTSRLSTCFMDRTWTKPAAPASS